MMNSAIRLATCFLCFSLSQVLDAAAQDVTELPRSACPSSQFIQSAYQSHFAPRAKLFSLRTVALTSAVAMMCSTPNVESLQHARSAWTEAMLAWESVSAVAVGPLLERHSLANIDFWPTRPNMIEIAMHESISDIATLRRVGVAARGLPALEWLLWAGGSSPPALGNAQACAYALLLTRDVAEEGQAVEVGFAQRASAPADQDSGPQLAELVNQSIGAVEGLRRKRLFNPIATRNPRTFARSVSDQAQPAWNAHWESILDLLVGKDAGETRTVEALLRECGLAAAAARVRRAAERVTAALQPATVGKPESIQHAAEALVNLRRTLEQDVALPLRIPVSFSDFDGD